MVEDISVEELAERKEQNEDLLIIDVREPFEYEEFNLGGRNIPLNSLPGMLHELEEFRNKEIIVHCRTGARSETAKYFLFKNGFTHVRNLIGGAEAWKEYQDN